MRMRSPAPPSRYRQAGGGDLITNRPRTRRPCRSPPSQARAPLSRTGAYKGVSPPARPYEDGGGCRGKGKPSPRARVPYDDVTPELDVTICDFQFCAPEDAALAPSTPRSRISGADRTPLRSQFATLNKSPPPGGDCRGKERHRLGLGFLYEGLKPISRFGRGGGAISSRIADMIPPISLSCRSTFPSSCQNFSASPAFVIRVSR